MFDMMKMMGKIKEAQTKMKEAQDGLVNITANGDSGAGLVTAKVNGKKEVISVNVDSTLMTMEDREMMQDLIVAAVNKAIENVEVKAQEHMKNATEGLLPNIPGMDLSGMM